ncbi:MAG: hypothetical protein WBN99_04730 [Mycobacterium sp.]
MADLQMLPTADAPNWLGTLRPLPGWCVGRIDEAVDQPWRIAVTGARASGGWESCETIAAFSFAGLPSASVINHMLGQALHSNGAKAVQTIEVPIPRREGAAAARGSGYIEAADRELWVQFTSYVVGSGLPNWGQLVQHCLYIDVNSEIALKDNIIHLSDSLHNRFNAWLNVRS